MTASAEPHKLGDHALSFQIGQSLEEGVDVAATQRRWQRAVVSTLDGQTFREPGHAVQAGLDITHGVLAAAPGEILRRPAFCAIPQPATQEGYNARRTIEDGLEFTHKVSVESREGRYTVWFRVIGLEVSPIRCSGPEVGVR